MGGNSALVVDSDQHVLDSEREGLISGGMEPVLASSYEEASNALLDQSRYYSAVFLNLAFPYPGGMKLLKLVRQSRPTTPVYLLYDQLAPFSTEELGSLAVHGFVQKSKLAAEIKKLCDDMSQTIEIVDSKGLQARELQEPMTGEMIRTKDNEKYIAVPVRDFLSCQRSFFDVYVRLPTGRFLKILAANDSFTPDRVIQYIEKGVTYFYHSHPSHRRCLSYCDQLVSAMLTHPRVSPEMKLMHSLNEGQKVIEHVKQFGLDDTAIDYMDDFLVQTRKLAEQLFKDKKELNRLINSKIHLYDHAVGVTLIASIVALSLGFESAQAFHTVGIAALLHDIGLYELPEKLQTEHPEGLSEEEMAVYQTHPEKGAEALAKIKGIESSVVQAVQQHHMRRNNTGYPQFTKSTQMSPLGEIVGISDEYERLITKKASSPSVDPLYMMHTKVLDGFSFPVAEAFDKAFGNQS